MMKVNINKVRARVAIHFDLRDSVLAETVKAGCTKVETAYESVRGFVPGDENRHAITCLQ